MVPTYLGLRVLGTPASVTVTSDDLARGYVDVPHPVGVSVTTNLRDGFQLNVSNVASQVRHAELSQDGERIMVARQAIAARGSHGQGKRETRLAWQLRLYLADDATAGEIAWPLRFALAP